MRFDKFVTIRNCLCEQFAMYFFLFIYEKNGRYFFKFLQETFSASIGF